MSRDEIAAVLAEHQWRHTRDTHCACGWRSPLAQLAVDGYLLHVADALLASPALAAYVARERAAALREAADLGSLAFAYRHRETWARGRLLVEAAWLRDRADVVGRGEDGEGQ